MFQKLVKTTQTWQRRRTDRSQLSGMDTRLLRDIGIDQMQAEREARKPFWKK